MSNIILRQIQAYGEIIIAGDVEFTSTKTISATANPSELGTSAMNITGDLLTQNRLFFTSGLGLNPPSLNTRSTGSRIVLHPSVTNSTGDYSIGLETSNMWFSSDGGFKFYNKATELLTLSSSSASLTVSGATTLTLTDYLKLRNTSISGSTGINLINNNGDDRMFIGYGNASFANFANEGFIVSHSNLTLNGGNITASKHLFIKSTGDVGVGTGTPDYKLHVSGTLGVTSTATFLATTESTSTNSGSVQISGGLGVAKSIWTSSGLYISGPNNTTTLSFRGDNADNNLIKVMNSGSTSATKFSIVNSGAASGTAINVVQDTELYSSLEYSGSDTFKLKTINNTSSGTAKKLVLEASSNNSGSTNANQLVLNTDGTIALGGNLSITGSITSGSWAASTISVGRGGTGQTSFTAGQLIVGNGSDALATYSGLTWTSGSNLLTATNLTVSTNLVVSNGTASIPEIITPSIQAQWTISGGGVVVWNGSFLKWNNKVIIIPIEKTELGLTGSIEITCPTSGTVTYYNSVNNTTTVTCTADGVPLGAYEALYYQITPGQSETFDQTKFRVVNYQNSTWKPSTNWILIAVYNGDSNHSHLKWIPGQVNFPSAGGTYTTSTGIGSWNMSSSGSQYYIPVFDSANVLSSSVIQQKSSKIGIGMDPATLTSVLQVQGEAQFNMMSTLDTTGRLRFGRQDGVLREHYIDVFNSATAANNFMRFFIHNGTLNSTTRVLSLEGDNSVSMNRLNLTGDVYFTGGSGTVYLTSATNALSLRNSGSTQPSQFQIINNSGTSNTGLFIYQSGTATSSADYAQFISTGSDYAIRTINSSTSGSAKPLKIETGSNTSGSVNSNQIYLGTDGKVGIGLNSGTYKLEVNGDVRIQSTVNATSTSAGALKVDGGIAVVSSIYTGQDVSTDKLTNRGFELILGNGDQSSRGDSGSSRALVKAAGNILVINNNGDYTGGTKIDSSLAITNGLTVTSIDITPSTGDLIKERSFSAANDQSSAANITGFAFAQASVRSFIAYVSVTIIATSNKYAQFELRGLQKDTGTWILSSSYIGDATGIVFGITSSSNTGQITYTSTNISGFVSNTIKFRSYVTQI